MSKFEKQKLVSVALVQFKDAKSGNLLYEDKTERNSVTGEDETVDDLDRPIGVMMVAPGSKEARAAEAAVHEIAKEKLKKLKAKDLTAEHYTWLATQKAARMITAFVEFEYKGGGYSLESALAFLQDPDYAHLADQCRAATGDYSAFLASGSEA